jgi:hypothetical protein
MTPHLIVILDVTNNIGHITGPDHVQETFTSICLQGLLDVAVGVQLLDVVSNDVILEWV